MVTNLLTGEANEFNVEHDAGVFKMLENVCKVYVLMSAFVYGFGCICYDNYETKTVTGFMLVQALPYRPVKCLR